MTTILHYAHLSQLAQRRIALACGQTAMPTLRDSTTEQDGVYRDDRGEYYTFRRVSLLTCEGCKHYIATRGQQPDQDPFVTFLAAYEDYLDGKIAYRDLPTQIYQARKLHDAIRDRLFSGAITTERAVELRWLVKRGEWRNRPWWDRMITRLLGGGPPA